MADGMGQIFGNISLVCVACAIVFLWDQEILSYYWFHTSLAPKVVFCSESRSQSPLCSRDMPVLVSSLSSLTEVSGAGAAQPSPASGGGLGWQNRHLPFKFPGY